LIFTTEGRVSIKSDQNYVTIQAGGGESASRPSKIFLDEKGFIGVNAFDHIALQAGTHEDEARSEEGPLDRPAPCV
jgi:hypothetical protein